MDSIPSQDDVRSTRPNMSWTMNMDNLLIETLVEQANLGNKVDKSFKALAYDAAVRAISLAFRVDCTYNNITIHLKTIKKNLSTISNILNSSGFSWNDLTKTIDAEPKVWAEYIQAHPEAGKFRRKAINNYDQLAIVCGNDQVTGARAFTAREALRQKVTTSMTPNNIQTMHEPAYGELDEGENAGDSTL
ncbi:PREDICTED: L10-interacting MYB domain-containing protein-like [Nelumbo nucifera]|uniref:L10-interacting MYB domain-containing protein-like n=1 Tax=Nelumbo nucifera TaxID=4432 RepID=A0A1U8BE39_NELNU|nr:PREDICTED: L10-interacting MYB domain-containing protein-like [Nelumbo nucifera]